MTIHHEKFKSGFYSVCSGKGQNFSWLLSEVNCGHCLNRLKKFNMQKIQLLYTKDSKLLWSKYWPEIPSIKNSVYADEVAMNNYNRQMKAAYENAIQVLNPDKAFEKIAFNERLERDKIYEVECNYKVRYNDGCYTIEIND